MRAIEDLIKQGVTEFLVGHQGQFDRMVRSCLKSLRTLYPDIRYSVVIAYLPAERRDFEDFSDTVYPEGIEAIHPKYAISWRNEWMIRKSQFVICYVCHNWGGAARYVQKARRQGKTVINLCPQINTNGVATV